MIKLISIIINDNYSHGNSNKINNKTTLGRVYLAT